jgi:hypothetical protein
VEYEDEEIPVARRRRCRAINDLDVRIMDDEQGGFKVVAREPTKQRKREGLW